MTSQRVKTGEVSVALGLAAVSFALTLGLALRFEASGAFARPEAFFHADPVTRLIVFTMGLDTQVFLKHPNLATFVHIPIRTLAEVLAPAGSDVKVKLDIMRSLALGVAPLAAGVKTFCLVWLLWQLGLRRSHVVGLGVLAVASFSNLIFGPLPDSFSLSGMFLAACFLVLALSLRPGAPARSWTWLALGTYGTGVTLTNLISFAWLVSLAEWFRARSLGPALLRSNWICGLVGVFTLVILWLQVGGALQPHRVRAAPQGIGVFLRDDPLQRALGFPAALANTYAPPRPSLVPVREASSDQRFSFEKAGEAAPGAWLLQGLLWAGVCLGAAASLRGSRALRTLGISALGILAYNWVFHSFWGSEWILYAQHWDAASLLLLAIGLRTLTNHPRFGTLGTTLLVPLVLGVCANNVWVLHGMLRTLQQLP